MCAGAMLGAPACGGTAAPATTPEAALGAPTPVEPPAVTEAAPEPEPEPEPIAVPPVAEPAPEPAPVAVAITSTPPGAAVYVGDEPEPRGTTPLALAFEPGQGEVTIRLEHAGFAPVVKTVSLAESVELDVALPATAKPRKPRRPRGGGEGGAGRGFVLS